MKKSRVGAGQMSEHHGLILGDQMREAIHINLGLLSLKQCVDAINRGASYVPFQNSKLTMLLSPALGGESKASVVVSDVTDVLVGYRGPGFTWGFVGCCWLLTLLHSIIIIIIIIDK